MLNKSPGKILSALMIPNFYLLLLLLYPDLILLAIEGSNTRLETVNEALLGQSDFITVPESIPVLSDLIPEDLWIFNRTDHLEHFSSYPETDRLDMSRFLSCQIISELVESKDLMQSVDLENWLFLRTASAADAVRIIQSPFFNASDLKYFNKLLFFYFEYRQILPFTAILQRFRFSSESKNFKIIIDHKLSSFEADKLLINSLLDLIISSNNPNNPSDTDPFIKAILRTQKSAFACNEYDFFAKCFEKDVSAWRFVTFYCEIVNEDIRALAKTLTLILIIRAQENSLTEDQIKFISTLPNFNISTEVSCSDLSLSNENQVLYTCEFIILYNWLTLNPPAWNYVELYFDIFEISESKSETLFSIVSEFTSPELTLIQKATILPNFDSTVLDRIYDNFFKKLDSGAITFDSNIDVITELFELWLLNGTSTWNYLKKYFELDKSKSDFKSKYLFDILNSPNLIEIRSAELIDFISKISNFDKQLIKLISGQIPA